MKTVCCGLTLLLVVGCGLKRYLPDPPPPRPPNLSQADGAEVAFDTIGVQAQLGREEARHLAGLLAAGVQGPGALGDGPTTLTFVLPDGNRVWVRLFEPCLVAVDDSSGPTDYGTLRLPDTRFHDALQALAEQHGGGRARLFYDGEKK